MTVMVRLTEKKVLARERVGSQYEYWLTTPESTPTSLLKQLKKKIFGFKPTEVVSCLIDSDEVSAEELAEMEKLLQNAKAKKSKNGLK